MDGGQNCGLFTAVSGHNECSRSERKQPGRLLPCVPDTAGTVFELQCAAKPPIADSICFRWCPPDCDFISRSILRSRGIIAPFTGLAVHDSASSDADTTGQISIGSS